VAVLRVARDRKWSIAKVEMGNGTFCASPGHLLDGLVGCENAPSGADGRVGHALISLAGTSQQAYINLYAGANGLILAVHRSGYTASFAFGGLDRGSGAWAGVTRRLDFSYVRRG
jgi:hypothetical protein